MKRVFEGRRADVSWGHLSIEGVERATEAFGQAVWEANDAVVMDASLVVRITVEACPRPITPGSRWKSKVSGVPKIVDYLLPDGGLMYLQPEGGGSGFCPRAEDWFRDNVWCSES